MLGWFKEKIWHKQEKPVDFSVITEKDGLDTTEKSESQKPMDDYPSKEEGLALLSELDTRLYVNRQERSALDKILNFLSIQNDESLNVSMSLARSGHKEVVECFLSFLLKLYRFGASAKEIIAILKIQDKHGWTFGMDLAQLYSENKSVMFDYLELLSLFKAECEDDEMLNDVFSLMYLKGKTCLQDQPEWSFMQVVSNCQDIEVTYKFIASGLLPDDEYKNLALKKEAIANHIFSIENQFLKKNALREALDNECPLGRFFLVKNGIRETSNHSANEKMKNELKRINYEDRIYWKATLFREGIIKEDEDIDKCLDFQDPFESCDNNKNKEELFVSSNTLS